MAKKKKLFKNFISKLESIDIQDLYKKAQSIKVEDIRSMKCIALLPKPQRPPPLTTFSGPLCKNLFLRLLCHGIKYNIIC